MYAAGDCREPDSSMYVRGSKRNDAPVGRSVTAFQRLENSNGIIIPAFRFAVGELRNSVRFANSITAFHFFAPPRLRVRFFRELTHP